MSDIVVTGGSGFLGAALLDELVRDGHQPLALVRRKEAAAEIAARHHGAVVAMDMDLGDSRSLRAALATAHPRVVFHLAGGRVGPGPGALRENFVNNVTPTVELLEALDLTSLDAFILVSTGEVYGPQPGPFHESLVPRPATAYAAAKLAAEAAVLGGCGANGPGIVARLGVVYGPGSLATRRAGSASRMLLPQLMEAALAKRPFPMSSGTQTRDFLFIDDAVRGLIELGRARSARGCIVNVGSGTSHAIAEVADLLLRELGRPIPLELGAVAHSPNEILDYRLDTSRLASLTGFIPKWSLADGIRQMASSK